MGGDAVDRRREFEEAVRPHLDALYRTAFRMTGRREDAEDLVQETTLRAFKSFGQFEPGTNFKAWVFRILVNSGINLFRKRARTPAHLDFADVEPAYEDAQGDDAWLDPTDIARFREALSGEVRRAVDELPADYRLPFLLSALERFSYKEIAGIAGVPVGTVMSRLFRARRILQKELHEYARREGFLKGEGAATGGS